MKLKWLFVAGLLVTQATLPSNVRAQRPAFLSDALAGPSSQDSAVTDPTVVRSRRATVDLTLLAEAGNGPVAAGDAAVAARSIELNLFADVNLIAQLERVEVVANIGYAWVGQVATVEGSRVILAVSDGVLSGTISVRAQTFVIKPLGGGTYFVAEVVPDIIPKDDAPLFPPAEARIANLRAVDGADSGSQYDLLMYYTTTAKNLIGSTAAVNSLITASIAKVNATYVASNIPTRVRLVGAVEIGLTESGNLTTDLGAFQASATVQSVRNTYGADLVALLVSKASSTASGVGYVSVSKGFASPDYGYSVNAYYSSLSYIYALAHELGHNQGSLHEPGNNGGDDTYGAYTYSLGYTDAVHKFYDVMSYGCTGCTQLDQFSSSSNTYNGFPAGSATQDNVRSITNTAVSIANYRASGGCAVVTILQTTLPGMTLSVAYGTTLTASGGSGPYTFSTTAGALPAGMSLTSGGVLSGTPATAGTSTFTIRATDANGCFVEVAYTMVIASTPACSVITIAQAALPNMTVGVAWGVALSASGGTAPYAFTVTSGALPAGITLTTAGVLSGTPTSGGTFTFTIRATGANGCLTERSYTMVIPGPVCAVITIAQTTLPSMRVGAAYGLTMTASGGAAPYGFSVTAGALPAGMTLTTAGLLAGTPTAGGTSTFTIRATDANGCLVDVAYTMVIPSTPTAQPPSPPVNFSASPVGNSAYLGWLAPDTGGTATSYIIEAGSAAGAADLATLSTTAVTYAASNVPDGTYYVRVRAVNTVGTSAPSNEVIVRISTEPR